MATNRDSDGLISVIRREPERSNLLLKLGIGVPVVIVIGDVVARLFIPTVAVAPITLALILLYGAGIALLAAHLVHTADRWAVDSAMQARRLWTVSRRANEQLTSDDIDEYTPDETEGPTAPSTMLGVSFSRVYFLLRLQEEVMRCRREGSVMSLVYIDAMQPGQETSSAALEKTVFEMANLASHHVKTISLPLHAGPTEYAFCLPHSNAEETNDFVSKLVRALGDYWCHFGTAVYPEDGSDAESLFNHAKLECDASRQGKSRRDLQAESHADALHQRRAA
jgi:hypothetical protein